MLDAKGKVTSGIPSLLPEKRSTLDKTFQTRHIDRENLKSQIKNDLFTVAPDGCLDTTNKNTQTGHALTSKDFIARLEKMNHNFIFEKSIADPTKFGIYLILDGEKRFICGFEAGYMPEFSIRHYKDKFVPDPELDGNWRKIRTFTKETRGWRTVLARLLRARLVTQPDIDKLFDFSRDSYYWKELTT